MTPTTYLQAKLKELHRRFPHIGIRYGIDTDINAHLVEVLPLEEYKSNKAFDKAWVPISLEFRRIFPDEDVAFFSIDSLLTLDTAIFELKPVYTTEKEILSHLFSDDSIGQANLPNGSYSEAQCVLSFITPVDSPEQLLDSGEIVDYAYPLAA